MKVQVRAKSVGMEKNHWVHIIQVRHENDVLVYDQDNDKTHVVKAWDICGVELSPSLDIHFGVGKVSVTEVSDGY